MSICSGGCDVAGLSARAILHGGTHHPHDPSDLLRCLTVSPTAPHHMSACSAEWSTLVAHWDELAALLRTEMTDGAERAPKTYARMRQLFQAAGRNH